MRNLILPMLLVFAACAPGGQAQSQSTAGEPWPTRGANAESQRPAFPGQTRAPAIRSAFDLNVEVIASGLAHPWALALTPDGSFLVTERPGRLRLVTRQGLISDPIGGLPAVDARNQGGLLDVTLSPNFAADRMVYVSFAQAHGEGTNGTSVARGRLSANATQLENVQVIFQQQPAWRSTGHFGSRVVFAPDGKLFITMGDRQVITSRPLAQDLSALIGKIARINPDGSIPSDNPFVNRAGARREIWSYGHRNVQSAAINPATGELWTVEHGAQGGDEVNIPRAGRNYGWPTITYGEEYSGAPIGQGITQQDGLEQPVYYWDPVIAPSGAVFYQGALFPDWRGDLLVGGLVSQALVRLKLDGERVVGEERLLEGQGRVRDIAEGPDGALYIVTDEDNGRLLRVTPRR